MNILDKSLACLDIESLQHVMNSLHETSLIETNDAGLEKHFRDSDTFHVEMELIRLFQAWTNSRIIRAQSVSIIVEEGVLGSVGVHGVLVQEVRVELEQLALVLVQLIRLLFIFRVIFTTLDA